MKICGLVFPNVYFKKHCEKRIRENLIKDEKHYTEIIKNTLKNANKFFVVRQFSDCKDKIVFYFNRWVVWGFIRRK